VKFYVYLVAVGLLGLAACTETEWAKPGVTEEEFIADSEDCAEMAHQQAKRDRWLYRPYLGSSRSYRYGVRYSEYRRPRPTLSELRFRHRFDCMASRGYELVPLGEQPSG
jgi:hypothetical protein